MGRVERIVSGRGGRLLEKEKERSREGEEDDRKEGSRWKGENVDERCELRESETYSLFNVEL